MKLAADFFNLRTSVLKALALPTSRRPKQTAFLAPRRPKQTALLASRRPIQTAVDDGFTLLELLVVLGILVLLATMVAPQVLRYLGKARTDTARAQISAISTSLELYALDTGGFPPQQTGLAGLLQPPPGQTRWKGPYMKKADGLIDPWGRAYQYRFPGKAGQPDVFTLGRDNAGGGNDEDQDVTN
jgi:general secretion pathway protein G